MLQLTNNKLTDRRAKYVAKVFRKLFTGKWQTFESFNIGSSLQSLGASILSYESKVYLNKVYVAYISWNAQTWKIRCFHIIKICFIVYNGLYKFWIMITSIVELIVVLTFWLSKQNEGESQLMLQHSNHKTYMHLKKIRIYISNINSWTKSKQDLPWGRLYSIKKTFEEICY